MTRETIFDLASLTKPLATTTALMLLVHEGAVDLDAPVAKYLPDVRRARQGRRHGAPPAHALLGAQALAPVPRAAAPSASARPASAARHARRARVRLRARSSARALVHEPGAAAVYSDLDFIAARRAGRGGRAAPLDDFCHERASGRSACARRFFVPLGEGGGMPDAAAPAHRRHRALPVARADPLRRGARRQRLGDGRRRRPRRPVRRRADDVMRFALTAARRAGTAAATSLPRETACAPSGPRDSTRAGLDLGARLGHADAGRVDRRARALRRRAVGHLGFTGTSLWIDLERDAHVVLLTNRVHPVATTSASARCARASTTRCWEALRGRVKRRAACTRRACGGRHERARGPAARGAATRVTGSDEHVYPPVSTLLERARHPGAPRASDAEHGSTASRPRGVRQRRARATTPRRAPRASAGFTYRLVPRRRSTSCSSPAGTRSSSPARTARRRRPRMLALRARSARARPRLPDRRRRRSTSTAASALGGGARFVVEGDEYDTAFFDKDAEVPALPPAHAAADRGRVRPRRHLPRPRRT